MTATVISTLLKQPPATCFACLIYNDALMNFFSASSWERSRPNTTRKSPRLSRITIFRPPRNETPDEGIKRQDLINSKKNVNKFESRTLLPLSFINLFSSDGIDIAMCSNHFDMPGIFQKKRCYSHHTKSLHYYVVSFFGDLNLDLSFFIGYLMDTE